VLAAAAVSTDVTGLESTIGVSMGGTVPMYQVCAAHRVPCMTLGAARADCRAHAPDENIRIEDLGAAARMMGRFVDAVAALPDVPRVP
jgi:acetylornithine deacetylase/succinyl-diaminopimelate desuccinylase-like protein